MILDTVKRLIKRSTDHVIQGMNRTWIVVGTDRKTTINTGYGDGGTNDVDSGTIDVVAGYKSENPDYKNDAARVYVSGKTDPDDYFGFSRGDAVTGEACVIVFADNSYISGRNVVKIITPNNHLILKQNGDIDVVSDSGNINLIGNVNLGDASASSFVSLSSLVDAVINAFVNAAPVPNDGGAAIQTAVKTVWAGQTNTTAATKVKAK